MKEKEEVPIPDRAPDDGPYLDGVEKEAAAAAQPEEEEKPAKAEKPAETK